MGSDRPTQQHRQAGRPCLDPGGAGSQHPVLSLPPVPPAASCAWAETACSARSCTAWWAGRRGTPVWTRTSPGPRSYPARCASASSPRVSRQTSGSVHCGVGGRGLSTGRGRTLGSVHWGSVGGACPLGGVGQRVGGSSLLGLGGRDLSMWGGGVRPRSRGAGEGGVWAGSVHRW